MTGQEFIERFAPIRDVEIQKCAWLFGSQAVYFYGDRKILQVSPSAHGCLIDPDTSLETLKSLKIELMQLVRLTDMVYTLRE